jgi:hypothetical protein
VCSVCTVRSVCVVCALCILCAVYCGLFTYCMRCVLCVLSAVSAVYMFMNCVPRHLTTRLCTESGQTPLSWVVRFGGMPLVEMLLGWGTNIEAKDNVFNVIPLPRALPHVMCPCMVVASIAPMHGTALHCTARSAAALLLTWPSAVTEQRW